MYCCGIADNSTFLYDNRQKNAFLRVMPLLVSQKHLNFSFKVTRFKMEKYKESCSRIIVFKEFSVLNSFTLEGSFLAQTGGDEVYQFLPADHKSLGEDVAKTFVKFMGGRVN